ncbi:hypothetical protein BOX15_Mlig017918g1 [Macrostomum lignano]|uniref:sn-1-specific diacylglycerol lipase n=1 Tax=Macrostomum lignano TaxID=282301 RepID=A0A267GZ30_9PLAT|nr:hypothetical protein BOX15_Mlig017918g1 [Macrostomum lignano]
MPGLVLFKRRWSIGSDDIVVPAALLFCCHLIQSAVMLSVLLIYNPMTDSSTEEFSSAPTTSGTVLPAEDRVNSTIATTTAVNGLELVNRSVSEWGRTVLSGYFYSQHSAWPSIINTCQFSVYTLIYLVLLLACLFVEFACAKCSLRGGILAVDRRSIVQCLLYVRLALFVLEILLLILGVVVLIRLRYFVSCTGRYSPIRVMTVVVAVNWSVTVLVLLTVWCVFDRAGRSWVKTRRFQQQQQQRQQQRRSVLDATKRRKTGSSRRRNLKHRQALLQYEQIWDRRFRRMFCCLSNSEASGAGSTEGAFAEVARLFSDFFQDLDVVPSDVVAGLVLLRRCQKLLARETLKDKSNQVLQFMSGRPIYLSTNFLQLTDPIELSNYRIALRCMKYALAAYGCPMLAYTGRLCCLLCDLNMCCCGSAQTLTREDRPRRDSTASCSSVCNSADNDYCDSDNSDRSQTAGCCCCRLYRPEASIEALLRQRGIDGSQFRLLHLCTDLGIERTPFYVGIDYRMRRVIVAIRGTLSLQDVLTDLTADSEAIPGCGSGGGAVEDDSDEGWFGHRGMVRTAIYIQSTLAKRRLIEQALDEPNCQNFDLILTGHSLGAGIASILGLLMRPIYGQRLQVLAFSPPGGLLSLSALNYSKEFITSVVVGKDVIPRVGLPQLEQLRSSLVRLISSCERPKWCIIGSGLCGCCCCCYCCCSNSDEDSLMLTTYSRTVDELNDREAAVPAPVVAAVTHRPLHLPGRIWHLVREDKLLSSNNSNNNSANNQRGNKRREKLLEFRVIDSEFTDFEEVLVSPSMVQHHMADYVLDALESVAPAGFHADQFFNDQTIIADGSHEEIGESVLLGTAATTVSASGDASSLIRASRLATKSLRTPRSSTLPSRLGPLTPNWLPIDQINASNSNRTSHVAKQLAAAPLATPESLSIASSRILSSKLSVAASAEDKPLSDEDDEDSDNFEMPMRSQLQRPVSLHENLSGYCYYLFPDEESGRRRPFDDILPKPRIDFGRIAHAVGNRQLLLKQQQQQQQQCTLPHSLSSCETLIPSAKGEHSFPDDTVIVVASAMLHTTATANSSSSSSNISNYNFNKQEPTDDCQSVERTPQMLRSSGAVLCRHSDRRVDYV